MKAPQQVSSFRRDIGSHHAHTLSRHTGVDLQVNRQAPRRQPSHPRGGLQHVQLPRLPNHRGQPLVNHYVCFAGKDSRQQQNARLGADGAHRAALFSSGHPQPLSARAGQQRGARQHVMPVGIGFDHRHQISPGAHRMAQLLKVSQQPLTGDLCPNGSGKHAPSIRPVLRRRPCSQSACSPPGRRDAPSRWDHCAAWR